MKKILVTGVGGPAGRSVIAMLAERNFSLVGVDMQPLAVEGYPFFQVPPATHPDFMRSIAQLAEENDVELIIPTVSEELPVFAGQWQYGDRWPVMVSPAQAVETANDKYLTALALAAHEVPVPYFLLPSQAWTPAIIKHTLGWPCISKPRVGRGGREVALHDPADFAAIRALSDDYILQEFIPGADYAPNVFSGFDGHNQVIVLEKTELKNGIVGNALSVRRVTDRAVGATALMAAKALGLTGPLDIDIRKRASGAPVVLEINARFGANIRYAPEILDASLLQLEMAR